MAEMKWYRVTDPLNPLCGCDVRGWVSEAVFGPDNALAIVALRRVDVFVGDRPYQLVAPEGETLGVAVMMEHLVDSPFQDDVMEVGDDRPFGLCLNESEMTRPDGCTLFVVQYERATQIALRVNGKLLATKTDTSNMKEVWETQIIARFELGDDQDDMVYMLRSN